jgi:hypothetical protein
MALYGKKKVTESVACDCSRRREEESRQRSSATNLDTSSFTSEEEEDPLRPIHRFLTQSSPAGTLACISLSDPQGFIPGSGSTIFSGRIQYGQIEKRGNFVVRKAVGDIIDLPVLKAF